VFAKRVPLFIQKIDSLMHDAKFILLLMVGVSEIEFPFDLFSWRRLRALFIFGTLNTLFILVTSL
jgi:hypothetical protein